MRVSGAAGGCDHSEVNLSKYRIIQLWLPGVRRSITYNLAQHVFVGVSFLAVGALFLYIFADFFSAQLPTIDAKMRHQANAWFCMILSGCGGLLVMGRLRSENTSGRVWVAREAPEVGWSYWSWCRGESPAVLQMFRWVRAVIMVITFWAAGLGLGRWLFPLEWGAGAGLWLGFHSGVAGLALVLGTRLGPPLAAALPRRSCLLDQLVQGAMRVVVRRLPARVGAAVSWKWSLLWQGSAVSRGLLLVMLSMNVLTAVLGALGGHQLSLLGSMWMASLLGSYGILSFAADAIRASVYEQLAGMTHRDYLTSLSIVVYSMAVLAWTCSGLALLLAGACGYHLEVGLGLKMVLAAHLPLVLIPSLILQVDPRSPVLNTLMLVLSSLFLGTAILAHLGFTVLVLVLIVAAWSSCKDRFYRA